MKYNILIVCALSLGILCVGCDSNNTDTEVSETSNHHPANSKEATADDASQANNEIADQNNTADAEHAEDKHTSLHASVDLKDKSKVTIELTEPRKIQSTSDVSVLVKRILKERGSLGKHDDLKIIPDAKKHNEHTFQKLQQTYKDVIVEGAILTTVIDDNHQLTELMGDFVPDISLSPEPSLTFEQALAVAKATKEAVFNDELAQFDNLGLRILVHDHIVLTYKVKVTAQNPNSGQYLKTWFINANTGDILLMLDDATQGDDSKNV